MVAVTELVIGSILVAACGLYGYRGATAGMLYRSLPSTDGYSSAIADGETTTVEGEVVVSDSAPAADSVLEEVEAPVGAYVWRGQYPDGTGDYSIDTDGVSRKMKTFSSGIESGTFAVVDGGREIRIDPTWIGETHDGADLSTFSLDGMVTSTPMSGRTWDSPYIHLNDHTAGAAFEAVSDVVDTADKDPSRYYLESKAVLEGQRLSVYGEVAVEQGDPVLRGSDETPLVISDRGFDDLGTDLRNRLLKNGAISLGMLAVTLFLLLPGGAVAGL